MIVVVSLSLLAAACASGDAEPSDPAPLPTSTTSSPSTTQPDNPPTTEQAAPTAALVPQIDEAFLEQQVAKSWDAEQPGAVLTAVFDADDGVVYAAAGTDQSGATPAVEDPIRVGSITKTFTAITVLSLVDDGLVELDAPVSDYVSRFEIDGDITVRNVLQHTSGIADAVGYLTTIADDRTRIWSPEEVLESTRLTDLEPGAEHAYANTNYTVLGVLIEEVTGRPYHEVVRERIIDPLEMDSTHLAFYEDGPGVFGGYYSAFGENASFSGSPEPLDFDFTSTATHAWASGGMVSSGPDLHVMISSLFDGSIIVPSLVDEMTANSEYGFGIFAPPWTSETPLFGHDGRISGAGTWLIHAPDTGATVFTMSNADYLFVSPATEAVAEAIGVPGVQIRSD